MVQFLFGRIRFPDTCESAFRPGGTVRNRGEIFKTFEIFMLPPGNTVILLYDGGKRVATKARCGCQFASKLDFSYTDLWSISCDQGGSKDGWRTFGISFEDCYAREISRFVRNICLR